MEASSIDASLVNWEPWAKEIFSAWRTMASVISFTPWPIPTTAAPADPSMYLFPVES